MHPIQRQIWLPSPPEDFHERCSKLLVEKTSDAFITDVRALSRTSFTINQGIKLAKLLAQRTPLVAAESPTAPLDVFILSQGTTTLLRDCLPAVGLRRNLLLTVAEGEYDQVLQQASDPTSPANTATFDAIVLLFDYRSLRLCEQSSNTYARTVIRQAVGALRSNNQSPIIIGNIPAPHWPPPGLCRLAYRGQP